MGDASIAIDKERNARRWLLEFSSIRRGNRHTFPLTLEDDFQLVASLFAFLRIDSRDHTKQTVGVVVGAGGEEELVLGAIRARASARSFAEIQSPELVDDDRFAVGAC